MQIAGRKWNGGGGRRRKDVGVFRDLQVRGVAADDQRPACGVVLIDVDQSIWVSERLFAEQDRVDEAEDCRIGANRQAKDQHRCARESPVAYQAPKTVARVSRKRIERRRTACIAAVFFDLLDAAEQPHGLQSRLFGREAAGL